MKDQESRSSGLIAQNVKEYFPEVVKTSVDHSGNQFLGIAYGKVSAIAIKAIQEHQEIIKSQKLKIDQLEGRLEDLENDQKTKINQLEVKMVAMQKMVAQFLKKPVAEQTVPTNR